MIPANLCGVATETGINLVQQRHRPLQGSLWKCRYLPVGATGPAHSVRFLSSDWPANTAALRTCKTQQSVILFCVLISVSI